MRILVTGGAGFIGSHVVEQLLERGHDVIVADNLETGQRSFIPAGARFYKLDISSTELEILFAIEQPEIVIHLAAQVDVARSVEDPMKDAQSNVMGTLRLLCCCRKHGTKRIVYSSSCAVYGDNPQAVYGLTESEPIRPLTFYGASKYTPELYIRIFHELYGLSYTILRYANVYGPRQTPKGEGGVIPIFIAKLFRGEPPAIYGDGEQTRDFIYVKDVAAANVLAAEADGIPSEVLNVGCHSKTSIRDLYHMIAGLIPAAASVAPVYLPARNGDIQDSCLDNRRVMSVLGWKPQVDLQRGLAETVGYYQHYPF